MSQIYIQVVFLIILAGVVFTLIKYSQEGDLQTFTKGVPNLNVMKRNYPNREAVIERLHALLIYKESHVRWNRFIIISMFTSLVILYYIRGEVRLGEFIILTCFIFLAIDLPNRWGYSHISKGVIQEGTQLYTYYHSLSQ